MHSSKEILEFYRPKDGESDNWTVGLIPGRREGITNFLGEESPVFAAIKRDGEDLLRARRIVGDLGEEGGATEGRDVPDALADEVCEAMSRFARSPSCRFYNIRFACHGVVQECFMRRAPAKFSNLPWTDAQYHAVVAYAFRCHFISLTFKSKEGDTTAQERVISTMEACLKARPTDARMYVMLGNCLMLNKNFGEAQEKLKKALEIDEEGCFGAHYTLANIMNNAVDIRKVNRMTYREQLQARAVLEGCEHHLKKYLQFAPTGHWHIHRACIMLMLTNSQLTAHGEESLPSMEMRQPGFCAEQHALFERAVGALKLHVNCFGREQSDFKFMYKQTAHMVSMMHKAGLVGKSKMPECEYVCGSPTCIKNQGTTKLLKCSRCESVRYCSKNCQTSHWKNGHKRDCKKLRKEYEARKKASKFKRFNVEMAQIGDRPTETEMESLFDD